MSPRPLAALALASLAMATPLALQQKPPVFRAEANYVEVTARVVDRNGRFVDGLTAADFDIREDHRRQTVETAIRVDLATPWNAGGTPTSPIYSPELARDLRVAGGRVYLMYLSSAGAGDVPITRKIAKDFVNGYLQPDDVVALWSLNGLVTFTSDRDRLNAGIGRRAVKILYAVHRAVIGDRERGHFKLFGAADQFLDLAQAVQQRKFSMDVQMHKRFWIVGHFRTASSEQLST